LVATVVPVMKKKRPPWPSLTSRVFANAGQALPGWPDGGRIRRSFARRRLRHGRRTVSPWRDRAVIARTRYQFFGRNYQAAPLTATHVLGMGPQHIPSTEIQMNKLLTWFGRIWVTCTVVVWLLLYFFVIPSDLTADWALFHISWVPIFGVPNPFNVAMYVVGVIVALPGLAAFFVRDKLRARRQQSPV
jgi:hypothetical protein